MQYDIVFVTLDYFDHPLCGVAILKRLLEKNGYTVKVLDNPNKYDIKKLEAPKLFFGISSGGIDSMLRNYTPMKKKRETTSPDRASIFYTNLIKNYFKNSVIVLGGVESSLRRFVHYDYWDNKLRKPILFDSKADILAYGNSEKQILEIAERIKDGKDLLNIKGTCVIVKELPEDAVLLPDFETVKEKPVEFCNMQNALTICNSLAQKIDTRYVLQYKFPDYTSKDLDEYYGLEFSRVVPKELRGFEFSVVTHRGCIGDCNFCSLKLIQGDRIISRSEESIIKEIKFITKLKHFKGNIDDLGGPSANMYGMDCNACSGKCIDCDKLNRSNSRLISLMRKIGEVAGVKNVYIKSGIRYDLASDEYIAEIKTHIYDTLKIAPEHIDKEILRLMNKDKGKLKEFIAKFSPDELSYYFMTAHPGSTQKEAELLSKFIKTLKNAERVQVFTPTPMTTSTCMYYTGLDPKTKKKVYVPYTYSEKKKQKRVLFD